VRSCVPSGPILGMIIRHGEAFTINDHLTVWQDGEAVYRPTVHYAYCPCDAALASMHELAMRGYVMQRGKRIMNDEIISGRDELGVLLLGHPYGAWWTGSVLSIDEARALVPGQSATTLQVAASVLGAVVWMIEHPREGVRVPDELPWREVLAVAMPYLGTLHSGRLEWDPSSGRHDLFAGWDDAVTDEDPLQFTNLSH
jgi:homospermidine synthase